MAYQLPITIKLVVPIYGLLQALSTFVLQSELQLVMEIRRLVHLTVDYFLYFTLCRAYAFVVP